MTNSTQSTSKYSRTSRLLHLYRRFVAGECVRKQDAATQYGVHERGIRRDIDALRCYLAEFDEGSEPSIVYNPKERAYSLCGAKRHSLHAAQLYAMCKVLLNIRPLHEDEVDQLFQTLLNCTRGEEHTVVEQIVQEERFSARLAKQESRTLEHIWLMRRAIHEGCDVRIQYITEGETEPREIQIKPIRIQLVGSTFKLVARPVNQPQSEATTYRFSRMKRVAKAATTTDDTATIDQEIELTYVQFRYFGASIDEITDEIPDAVVSRDEKSIVITARVEERRFMSWFLSMRNDVELLTPDSLRLEMKETIERMWMRYTNI